MKNKTTTKNTKNWPKVANFLLCQNRTFKYLYYQYFIKEKTFKTKRKERHELEVFFPRKISFLSWKDNHM